MLKKKKVIIQIFIFVDTRNFVKSHTKDERLKFHDDLPILNENKVSDVVQLTKNLLWIAKKSWA